MLVAAGGDGGSGPREHDDLERWCGGRAVPWRRADPGSFGAHALSRCARVVRMDSRGPLLATHFLLEKQVEARRFKYGSLACKDCHKLTYASQQQDVITRKRLSAAKLRLQLGGLPDINEPLPAKLKWKHRKRYQALRNQIHNLEASIKGYRFEKPLSTKLFAYHVG